VQIGYESIEATEFVTACILILTLELSTICNQAFNRSGFADLLEVFRIKSCSAEVGNFFPTIDTA